MNDFASALSTALHEEAKEIGMSSDLQEAQRQLEQSMRSSDQRRRVWVAVAAAAAVVLVVAGVYAGAASRDQAAPPATPTPTASPTQGQPPVPFPLTADLLHPPLTAVLPSWVTIAAGGAQIEDGAYGYSPYGGCPGRLCADGNDRGVRLYSVEYMYPLPAGSKITKANYTAYVKAWKAVQQLGYGTLRDVGTTTVDGKPATTMTVTFTNPVTGLARCSDAGAARSDCWAVSAGRTFRMAIVDQGRGKPVTLLYEGWNTANPDAASYPAEFASWLATVRFT